MSMENEIVENETTNVETEINETQGNVENANAQSVEENAQAVDLDKFVSRDEYLKLKSTADRLLEESKKEKAKRQKAQEEKLLAEGKKDEVITQQRTKLEEMQDRIMSHNISTAVEREAQRRGCEDWDQLLQIADTSDIQYDEDTESVSGIATFFDRHANNPRFAKFFAKKGPIPTETRTPSMESMDDYKKDPLSYLKKVKKERPADYESEVHKLRREGVIS